MTGKLAIISRATALVDSPAVRMPKTRDYDIPGIVSCDKTHFKSGLLPGQPQSTLVLIILFNQRLHTPCLSHGVPSAHEHDYNQYLLLCARTKSLKSFISTQQKWERTQALVFLSNKRVSMVEEEEDVGCLTTGWESSFSAAVVGRADQGEL